MKLFELESELQRIYGTAEGLRVYQTVMPGILSDFLKMLGDAANGARVSEEYRLEDGRGSILLSAEKTRQPAEIEACFKKI